MDVRSEDAGPFDLNPSARRAALLIHGFTGTPFEMRPLGEKLAERGIRAVGLRLTGHGGSPEELAQTSYRDWIAGADDALAKLRSEADRVAVVGLSLGGLIGLDLARRTYDLAALACLAVPLWLPRATVVGIRAAAMLVKQIPKIGGADIRDGAVKRGFPTLAAFPLAPLLSLMDLQAMVRPLVPSVRAPTIIVHADRDHVAPPACARELYERLPTKDKKLVRLPESFHIITVDVERDLVAREVGDFLDERL